MIFIFSLVIAALLCIASFICYKVSGKMLDEKDAEKCAKEAELEEKLIDLMMQTRSKPLSDDEFSFGGAYQKEIFQIVLEFWRSHKCTVNR